MELWRLNGHDGSSISVSASGRSGDMDPLDCVAEIEIDTPLRRLTCRGRQSSTASVARLLDWLVGLTEKSPANMRPPIYVDRTLGLSMMPLHSGDSIQSIEVALGPLPEEDFWDSVVVVLDVHLEELTRLQSRVNSLLSIAGSASAN